MAPILTTTVSRGYERPRGRARLSVSDGPWAPRPACDGMGGMAECCPMAQQQRSAGAAGRLREQSVQSKD